MRVPPRQRLSDRFVELDGLRLFYREGGGVDSPAAAPPSAAVPSTPTEPPSARVAASTTSVPTSAPSTPLAPLPPIVLVHGLIVSGRYFVPAAERLARHTRVLVPDLPGFGRSQGPRSALDVLGLAAHLGRWIAALELPPPLLVAHSFGCQVAAELAAAGTTPLAGLVLAAPTVDPARPGFLAQAAAFLANARNEPVSLALIIAGDVLRAGPLRAIATLRAALRHRIADVLPRVEQPTLVLHGERDPLCPARWAAQVEALLPRGRLQVMQRAPHALHYTAPEAFAAAILAFAAAAHHGE
jgi:2-hydroxy-6-oxonona-2,4-dienedioate hydrolase